MDKAKVTLAKYRDYLMSLDNVVGVGIGNKVVGGEKTSETAIIVFVSRKLPQVQLKAHSIVPRKLDKVSTDVMEIGRISLYARTGKVRPGQPGTSIGHYQGGGRNFWCPGEGCGYRRTAHSVQLSCIGQCH